MRLDKADWAASTLDLNLLRRLIHTHVLSTTCTLPSPYTVRMVASFLCCRGDFHGRGYICQYYVEDMVLGQWWIFREKVGNLRLQTVM